MSKKTSNSKGTKTTPKTYYELAKGTRPINRPK